MRRRPTRTDPPANATVAHPPNRRHRPFAPGRSLTAALVSAAVLVGGVVGGVATWSRTSSATATTAARAASGATGDAATVAGLIAGGSSAPSLAGGDASGGDRIAATEGGDATFQVKKKAKKPVPAPDRFLVVSKVSVTSDQEKCGPSAYCSGANGYFVPADHGASSLGSFENSRIGLLGNGTARWQPAESWPRVVSTPLEGTWKSGKDGSLEINAHWEDNGRPCPSCLAPPIRMSIDLRGTLRADGRLTLALDLSRTGDRYSTANQVVIVLSAVASPA